MMLGCDANSMRIESESASDAHRSHSHGKLVASDSRCKAGELMLSTQEHSSAALKQPSPGYHYLTRTLSRSIPNCFACGNTLKHAVPRFYRSSVFKHVTRAVKSCYTLCCRRSRRKASYTVLVKPQLEPNRAKHDAVVGVTSIIVDE